MRNYSAAQANPQVTGLAALELREAGDALDRANTAQSKHEDSATVDHLAYLARQRIAIAQETARLKAAEAAIVAASGQRDRARLEARTREAQTAQMSAETARLQAEFALRQAEARRQQALDSQQQAQIAQQQAQAAQLSADAARSQAQETEMRARLLEEKIRDLQAKKTDRGLVVTLGDVLFDVGQATLNEGGIRNLQKVADFLRQYPQRTLQVEGFTDSTGNAAYNQGLSERRADAVRNELMHMGVAASRISVRGYGESFPVASNNTPAGRQLNRRVEVVISDEGGSIASRS